MKTIAVTLLLGLSLLRVTAGELPWNTDLAKALEKAKAEKKLVLIDFTGSDWCGFCKKLDAEVYHSAKFAEYAKKKLVLVRADFPRKIEQSAELKKANEALKTKYAVKGFPTTVILDSNGEKLGQKVGYPPGSGPDKFIAEIEKIAGS